MSFLDSVRRVAAKTVSYAPVNLALAAITPATRSEFEGGVFRILGGDGGVGGYNPSTGGYNPTFGDAWRSTVDDFTPGYIYQAPPEQGLPGTQKGNVLPQGLVPDKWESPLQKAALVAALGGGVALVVLS